MPKTNGESQLEQLARVSNELLVAEALQDHANQTSIWAFNALTCSDAFIDKVRQRNLLERLEKASTESDELRDMASVLVETLRDEKRKLSKRVGSGVNSPAMKIAEESAEQQAQESASVQAKVKAAKPVAKKKAQADASV